MLRDAYVRAIVAEHFPTFDRIRHHRDNLARVSIVLPGPMLSVQAAPEVATEAGIIALHVRIPLVVHAPDWERAPKSLRHEDIPLIGRTAFFRIMEGQVLDALNVQRAWPDDLEDWDADEWSSARAAERLAAWMGADAARRDLVAGEVRRRLAGPRHIRDILAPLIEGSGWADWLRKSATRLERQDRAHRREED